MFVSTPPLHMHLLTLASSLVTPEYGFTEQNALLLEAFSEATDEGMWIGWGSFWDLLHQLGRGHTSQQKSFNNMEWRRGCYVMWAAGGPIG